MANQVKLQDQRLLTTALTNGKLVHLIIPKDMSEKDHEILSRFVELQQEATEYIESPEQTEEPEN